VCVDLGVLFRKQKIGNTRIGRGGGGQRCSHQRGQVVVLACICY